MSLPKGITKSKFIANNKSNGYKEIINKNEDSIIIFTARAEKAINRQVLGVEKAPISEIL